MTVEYGRTMEKSYMRISGNWELPHYQLQMCSKYRIANLLESESETTDGRLVMRYDISGKRAFLEYLKEKSIDYMLLFQLLTSLFELLSAMHEYLLEEEFLCLQPELIYIQNGQGEISFCYCQQRQALVSEQLHSLMEMLLSRLDHADQRAVTLAYAVYQKTLEPNCDLGEIRELLNQTSKAEILYDKEKQEDCIKADEDCRDRPQADVGRKQSIQMKKGEARNKERSTRMKETGTQEKAAALKTNLLRKIKALHLPQLPLSKIEAVKQENLWEPVEQMYGEACEQPEEQTILISADEEPAGLHFLGAEVRADIRFTKESCLIGSGADADIRIPARTVSRSHARVTKEGESCYLEDLNSKNGTQINARLLHYKEKVRLENGDIVSFADERYRFFG